MISENPSKLEVRACALALLLLSPIVLPIASMHAVKHRIIYFFIDRWGELRTGNPWWDK